MDAKLRLKDAQGRIIYDNTRIVRSLVGRLTFGGAGSPNSGSITDDRLLLGAPWFQITQIEITGFIGYMPQITFSGSNLNWYLPPTNANVDFPLVKILYGVQ